MLKLKVDMFIMRLRLKMRSHSAIILNITLLLLICVCIAIAVKLTIPSLDHTFTINDYACTKIFDCTPSEFFDRDLDFYEKTGDFREKSYIDENGSLVLVVTKKQGKLWLKTKWLNSFVELEELVNAQINSDGTKMTIYISPETKKGGEKFDECVELLLIASYKLAIIQTLNGAPIGDVFVELTEIDENGQVYHTKIRPAFVE